MNDTKITPRQLQIMEFLSVKPYSREELSRLLGEKHPVSRITLIRDLNSLLQKKLIKITGVGRARVYVSNQNPILRMVDLEEYFEEGSDLRKNLQSDFDFKIFKKLKDLFSDEERKEIQSKVSNLNKQIAKMDPTLVKREIERFIIEFSWKSSKIEGNTYTLLETEALIKHEHQAYGKSKYEADMILNHKRALDFILNNSEYFKHLTLKKILKVHDILIKDLEITHGIRNGSVAITGTEYVPLKDRNQLTKALSWTVRAINKSDFPLEKALIASVMISFIQGFFDGNKRTARTIANAILIANCYYPLSYRNVNEAEYVKSLILFYEQRTLYAFKKIILDQFYFSQQNYFKV